VGLVSAGFYTTNDFNYNTTTGAYTLKPGVPAMSSTTNGGPIQPGSLKFVDLNNDGIIDFDNDRKIIGDPTPDFTGGLFQQFTYKNWDASLFINFSLGNDVYNANKIELTNGSTANSNMLAIMANRWRVVTPNGQTAQWFNTTTNTVFGIPPDQLSALNANATIWQPARGTGAAGFFPSSWAIEDGSFLRINNLTIGYSLPVKKFAGISKLRFLSYRKQLSDHYNYSGYDPK
jgi:hypothetical protein